LPWTFTSSFSRTSSRSAAQLVLGRDLQADVVLPGGDAVADDLFDLVIERNDPVFAPTGVNGLLAAALGDFRHWAEHSKFDGRAYLVLLS